MGLPSTEIGKVRGNISSSSGETRSSVLTCKLRYSRVEIASKHLDIQAWSLRQRFDLPGDTLWRIGGTWMVFKARNLDELTGE